MCRWLELLIIDEADRLKTAGLELVRDYLPHQRRRRCPDRDARIRTTPWPATPSSTPCVDFAPHYRPLDAVDIPQVLSQYWQQLGQTREPHRQADAESVVSIVCITGGNFRLVERLMSQVARTMTINNLDTITPDAMEAAREVLVVGI